MATTSQIGTINFLEHSDHTRASNATDDEWVLANGSFRKRLSPYTVGSTLDVGIYPSLEMLVCAHPQIGSIATRY